MAAFRVRKTALAPAQASPLKPVELRAKLFDLAGSTLSQHSPTSLPQPYYQLSVARVYLAVSSLKKMGKLTTERSGCYVV